MVLEGQVALITGAGSGIGKATSLRLAKEGASIAAADLNLKAAADTADDVRTLGREAMEIQVDVSQVSQIQSMVDSVIRRFGRIDILVPAAGVVQMKKMLEVTEVDWDRLYDVNVKGVFFTLQAVAKQMVAQGSGAIVTISSISAQGSRPMQVHYASGKAAIVNMTWTAAATLALLLLYTVTGAGRWAQRGGIGHKAPSGTRRCRWERTGALNAGSAPTRLTASVPAYTAACAAASAAACAAARRLAGNIPSIARH